MNAPWIKEEDVPAFVAWLDLFAEGQRALGYKAGLEVSVKVIKSEAAQYAEPVWAVEIINDIAALPVLEIKWRDLTDGEIEEVCISLWSGGWRQKAMNDFARAVITAFKDKNK